MEAVASTETTELGTTEQQVAVAKAVVVQVLDQTVQTMAS